MRIALLLWISSLVASAVAADGPGNPPVQVYPVAPLGVSFQNLNVAIAPDGRLIVANNNALLVFDGAHWQAYKHPSLGPSIWSVVAQPDGRLYAAVDGDIGWFQPDAGGGYRFESLTDQLPAEARKFGVVYQVEGAREGIWFNPTNHLLLWRPDRRFQVFTPGVHYSDVYKVGDSVWIQEGKVGLLRPVADGDAWRLERVPGTDYYAERAINGLADLGSDGVLLVSPSGEIQRWQNGELQPFAQALWPALAEALPKRLLALRDGRIAISNTRDGPWVIDRQGQLVERYGDANGVPSVQTFGMAEDAAGGLWLAQEHAVVRIDRGSGVSQYDRTRGIPEAQAIETHQGAVYAGALAGIYRLQGGDIGGARFERVRVPGAAFAFDLRSLGDWLWIAGNGLRRVRFDGAGAVAQDDLVSLVSSAQCRRIAPSPFHPDRLYASCNDGIYRIDDASGASPGIRQIAPVEGNITALVETDADTLWAANSSPAFLRLTAQPDGSYALERFDSSAGVPPSGRIAVYPGRDGPWFAGKPGLLRFDAQARRFGVRTDMPLADGASVLFEDAAGNLWARTISNGVTGVWWREGAGYRWDNQPFAAVDASAQVFEIERNGDIVWLARSTGVTRLDLRERQPPPAVAAARVVSVRDTRNDRVLALTDRLTLAVNARDLRIGYALPAFVLNSANRYRSRLVGFDADWSDWDARAERDYTNLPDGELRFEVEARDAYGRVSAATPLILVGLAPWWRTPLAYAALAAALLAALVLAGLAGARWRQRALMTRQRELEATVAARTLSLSEQNQQLADQATQLQVQAERLRAVDALKTRFFTNVGHEFRTPLTLVLGPLDDVMRDGRIRLPERARELLELANRNAKRVLDLIVQLLDVNRLEHGQLPMQRERVELIGFFQRQHADWQALAERFGHRLELALPAVPALELDCDPLQLERALGNLVSNAAKYTPRGGQIQVSLSCTEDAVTIVVADTGQGIAADALPYVFDRFFQAQSGHIAQGTGIGLALVREIIEGHEGSVRVDSTPGSGSRFTLTLPRAALVELTAPLPTPPAEAAEHTATAASERPVALVIDDHSDLRLRLRRLLEPRFRVVEAEDGPAGLAAARSELPDIIVCDVMMPGFDGVELAKRVRADADIAAVPMLLLTAKAGAEHAVTGLRAGADDYLSKPFDASELLARIDALLALRRRLQRVASTAATAPPANPIVSDEDKFRARLDAAIQAHVGDNEFGVEELAQALHSDRSTLFRRIKELYGQNARDYLREARLKHAFELLSSRAGNVTEVAYAAGFESLSSFSRAFRQRFGVSPSAAFAGAGRQAC